MLEILYGTACFPVLAFVFSVLLSMIILIRPIYRWVMQNYWMRFVVTGFLLFLMSFTILGMYIGNAMLTQYDVMFACRLSPFTDSPSEYCSDLYYRDGNATKIQRELTLRKIIPVDWQADCYSDDTSICTFVDEIFGYGHVYPVNWLAVIMVMVFCSTPIIWFVLWWTSPHEYKHKIRTLRLTLGGTLVLSLFILFMAFVISFNSINPKHVILTMKYRSEVVAIVNEEATRRNSRPYYNEAFRTVFQGQVRTVYEYEPTCIVTLITYQGIAPTGRQFGGGRLIYKMELQQNNTWSLTEFDNTTWSQRHTIFPQPSPELTCDTST